VHVARRYFRQTCDGLEYIHSQGVIHKDIKPGNLLIAPDDTVRIADFGVAEQLSSFAADDHIVRSSGTLAFQPPEVFNQAKEDAVYPGFKLDVWSMGVTLYVVCYVTCICADIRNAS
jgi:serine/threonine protein kinase